MKNTRIVLLILVLSVVAGHAMFAQSPSFSRSDIDTGLPLSGGVVVGDFNSDGKPDMLVGVYGPPSPRQITLQIYLLIGNGDGTFKPPSLVFSGCCAGLSAADVNGDGKLDVLFTGINSEIWVLLGNGDGTFDQNPIRSPGVASGRNPVVMDFNRDGRLDLAFAPQGGGISVLLGNGDGTFGEARNFPITGGVVANSLVAADFNGDGILDLAASDLVLAPQFADTVSVLLGNGDGTFGPPTDFTVGTYPFPLAAADFNGDGKVDLGVANYVSNSVSVLLGNGDGTFLPKVDFPVGPFPVGLASADFNGDGKLDLAVGGGLHELSILSGNGDGTFAAKEDFPTASSMETLTIGDLNLDGKPDAIVVYFAVNSLLSVFLNTTVADSTPPVITVSASPSILWPPNGRLVPVTISGTITDAGSGVNAATGAYSVKDEYGEIHPMGAISLGPGGTYSFVILLRASRRGSDLNGRSYKITVRAKDNAGNVGSKTALVTVPHQHPSCKIKSFSERHDHEGLDESCRDDRHSD